jgi:hypothetical protein
MCSVDGLNGFQLMRQVLRSERHEFPQPFAQLWSNYLRSLIFATAVDHAMPHSPQISIQSMSLNPSEKLVQSGTMIR